MVPVAPLMVRVGLTQTFLIPYTLIQKPSDEKPVETSE